MHTSTYTLHLYIDIHYLCTHAYIDIHPISIYLYTPYIYIDTVGGHQVLSEVIDRLDHVVCVACVRHAEPREFFEILFSFLRVA
jgi:hypothetical protein